MHCTQGGGGQLPGIGAVKFRHKCARILQKIKHCYCQCCRSGWVVVAAAVLSVGVSELAAASAVCHGIVSALVLCAIGVALLCMTSGPFVLVDSGRGGLLVAPHSRRRLWWWCTHVVGAARCTGAQIA